MAREENRKRKEKIEDGVFLVTADDTIKAEIIESKLAAFNIPVRRKHREMGAYLTLLLGKSNFGVDFYVPADRLEEAQDIISSGTDIKDEEILEDPSFNDEKLAEENRDILKKMDRQLWIIAGAFFIALGILVYFIFRG